MDNSLREGFKKEDNLKGTLKEFRLADLLIDFQKGLKTGVLEVKSGSDAKNIYLKGGDMVFASSNSKKDRLGEILLKKGKINIDEYNRAFNLSVKTKKRLGNILVKRRHLTQKELVEYIRYQIEEIISSLFTAEGTFEFYERPVKDEVITLKTSTANIIYKSIKKIESLDYLKSLCPSKETILSISPYAQNILKDIYLEKTDKDILYYVNGFYTLELILLFSPYHEGETLKTICALLGTHFIRVKNDNEPCAELSFEEIFTEHDNETTEEAEQSVTAQEAYTQAIRAEKKVSKKDRIYIKTAVLMVMVTAIITVMFVSINKKSERLADIQKEQKTTLPAFREDIFEKLSAAQKKQHSRLPSFREKLFNKISDESQG